MRRIVLLALLALIAALVVGCQDDRDEPVTESRQPSTQNKSEVTHEVTQEVTVEKTLPDTSGVRGAS